MKVNVVKHNKSVEKEINAQIAEQMDIFKEDIDAILLWFMHTEYGFGEKRLKGFIFSFNERLDDLSEMYKENDMTELKAIKEELKKMGIDKNHWFVKGVNINE